MYLSIRNGVCKVFAKNEVGQSNKEQARLEWQALRTGVRNVSNVSVWLTCLSKSLNSNPYATATTRTLPSAESARTLERHLHDPRKVSIHCFVFASCTLFSPRVSLSRRGQGAMFAQPSLKVLHMRMLNEETSVPLRAKGQATFKTPEDQNLLSGKQDADPYALFAHVGWSSALLLQTAEHVTITDSWLAKPSSLAADGRSRSGWRDLEKKRRWENKLKSWKSCHTSSSRSHGALRESVSRTSKNCCHLCSGSVACSPRKPGIPYCWFFSDKKEGK